MRTSTCRNMHAKQIVHLARVTVVTSTGNLLLLPLLAVDVSSWLLDVLW